MKQETIGKKILRQIISWIVVFLFSLLITLAAAFWMLGDLVSEACVMKVVDEIGYEELVRENIQESFESLCETSGVPASLTTAFLEEEVTREDILLPILQMFTQETLEPDTETWKEAFSARVEHYAQGLRESGELSVSDEDWEAMKAGFPEMANYFVKEVRASIRLSGLFAPLGSAFSVVAALSPYLTWGSIVGAAFCALLLLLIWKKRVWYFAYVGMTASGILFLLPALLYRAQNYVSRLGIQPIYLKRFLSGIVDLLAQRFLQTGTIFLVVGAVFGILVIVLSLTGGKKKSEANLEQKKEQVL